jgi:hypothetical protein
MDRFPFALTVLRSLAAQHAARGRSRVEEEGRLIGGLSRVHRRLADALAPIDRHIAAREARRASGVPRVREGLFAVAWPEGNGTNPDHEDNK